MSDQGPIVAWLVYSPVGDECDYYVFAEKSDAWDRQAEFDEADPEHEHAIVALVASETWDYWEAGK